MTGAPRLQKQILCPSGAVCAGSQGLGSHPFVHRSGGPPADEMPGGSTLGSW